MSDTASPSLVTAQMSEGPDKGPCPLRHVPNDKRESMTTKNVISSLQEKRRELTPPCELCKCPNHAPWNIRNFDDLCASHHLKLAEFIKKQLRAGIESFEELDRSGWS